MLEQLVPILRFVFVTSAFSLTRQLKIIQAGRSRIKLQIWDTAGQEKFRSVPSPGLLLVSFIISVMTSSYFGGAAAVIIVFDLTDQKSFVAVEKWIKEAQSFSDQSRPLLFLIVGNKKGQFVPPLVVS